MQQEVTQKACVQKSPLDRQLREASVNCTAQTAAVEASQAVRALEAHNCTTASEQCARRAMVLHEALVSEQLLSSPCQVPSQPDAHGLSWKSPFLMSFVAA